MNTSEYQRINHFREWLNKIKQRNEPVADKPIKLTEETYNKLVKEFEKTNDVSPENIRRILRIAYLNS